MKLKTYSLLELSKKLNNHHYGDFFKIKFYKNNNWVFYDENKDFFFIKEETTKDMILIKKLN